MHKNNFYVSFGIWLILIPLLGVPIVWRDALVFISGLFLISVSLGPTVLKKLQSKPKQKKKKELAGQELKFTEIPGASEIATNTPTPYMELDEEKVVE